MRSVSALAILLGVTVAVTACGDTDPTSSAELKPAFDFEDAPENSGVVHRYDNVPQGLSFCADGYCAYHGIDPAAACAGNWWNDPLWDFQEIENPAEVENWVAQANDVHIYIWPVWWDCDYMLSHQPVAAGFGNFRDHSRWRNGIRYEFKWKAQGQLKTPTGQWVENPANGHWYAATAPMNWMDAEARATGWDGHLVTINDADEDAWLTSKFGSEHGAYWIGFNDIEEEGNWVWVSGQAVTYTNWAPGEPNNSCGVPPPPVGTPENAAAVFWYEGLQTYRWNDVPEEVTYAFGVVERTTKPTGEKRHYNGRSSWVRDANGKWHVNRFIKLN